MTIKATTTAVLVALLLGSLWAPTAAAGGAHLDFEQEYYMPGDTVRAQGVVWVKPDRRVLGSIEDGPFYAYLKPHGKLLPVATLQIEPWPKGQHGDVSVEFVLPQLDPGYYWLHYCNASCKKPLGDLMTGQLNVVADKSEARVLDLSLRISEELGRVKARSRSAARSNEKRTTLLVNELEARVVELEDAIEALKEPERRSDSSLPIIPAGLVAIPLGLLWWRRSHNNR